MATVQAQYINVLHGSCNYKSYDKVEVGSNIRVTVTADEGYYFPTRPNFTINSSPLELIPMETDQTGNYITEYYFDYNNVQYNFSVSITNTTEKPTTYKMTVDLDNATCNISNNAEYAKDDSVYINVKANEGFYFAEAPFIRYFELGVPMTVELAPVGSSAYPTEYQTTYLVKGATTITAEAVTMPTVEKYSFTVDVDNATCNISNGAEYDEGTTVHIEVTAEDGYYFDSVPNVYYLDLGVPMRQNMTAIDGGDYPTKYAIDYTINHDCTISASAIAKPVEKVTFTYGATTQNCTCNIENGAQYDKGTELHIEVAATEGYYFGITPFIESDEGDTDLTPVNPSEQYKTSFVVDYTINSNSELIARAVAIPVNGFKFETEITNATTNVNTTDVYPKNEVVRVTVTANEGYGFTSAPTLKVDELGVGMTYQMESDDTGDYKKNFYYDFTYSSYNSGTVLITAHAQVIPNVDKYGVITMYNPTATELKAIAEERYIPIIDGGTEDLGQYIASLKKLFINIPQGNKATVLLGGYSTDVQSNVIVDDIITTECGSITITGAYNNVMDYNNTAIEIFLPFVGFANLDTVKVMNKTLKLLYKTNVINGDSLACIFTVDGNNEQLIYTFDCNVSFEIPYKMNQSDIPQGKLDIDSNYLYGFTPFVIIRANKPYNTSNIIANDNRQVVLNTLTGFVKCAEVFNTIQATSNERNEIDSLLKSGVLI